MSLGTNLSTRLTRLLGIRTPVVLAPMAGASGGALAAAVTRGGGFGFAAAGYDSPEKFNAELSLARSALNIQLPQRLPIGIGFLGWQLEKPGSAALELLSITLENNVQAVWFAFGDNLGRWVQLVRDHDQKAGNDKRTIIFAQINSLEEARVAVNDWKVDVLVAQGIESGGHGHSAAPPILTLVSSILAVVPKNSPPLLAAGGLSQGSHVASMITLGASGVVLGTRFLLGDESLYTAAQKQALVNASSDSTVRTMAFDHARGSLGWPKGVDGRGLRNLTVEDYENGVELKEVGRKFAEGVFRSDPERMLVWAGTGVGLMTKTGSAEDIVKEIHEECVQHLQSSISVLG